MATDKEVLQQLAEDLLKRIDFHRRILDTLPDYPPLLRQQAIAKIDELLDNYNDILRKIEKL